MKKKIFSILLALVLVSSFSLVTAVPVAAQDDVELSVTGDGVSGVSLAEMDQHFSTDIIDASAGDTLLSGSVTLGNFDAGNGDDVWYEVGLVSDTTYLGYSRLHNKGVYMIALWDAGNNYQVHIQNVPGYKPDATGNYLGTGDCYFTTTSATFDFEIKYHDVTASDGKVDLRINDGTGWTDWKLYQYAEDDVERVYGFTSEQAAAYGYHADDDLTSARIVSQIFVETTQVTFTATYDNIQINGVPYALAPRVLNVDTGEGYAGIQPAIDEAQTGHTINVAAGTYTEDLVIPGSKTNLELVGATGATIKGVQVGIWPTHVPSIDVLASGVKIHGFTIESPDYSRTTGNPHSSGIAVGAANVEIYDNTFVSTDDGTGNSPGWCTSIETYGAWAGDISGLYIHHNIFTSDTGTDKGSEGIYINYNSDNPTPVGTVTIANNTFGGQIFRAITTERSKTTINGNTITSSYAPNPAFNAALRGIDVFSPDANQNPNIDTVVITDNSVNGFWQGIRLGDNAETTTDILTNISVTNNTVEMNTTGIRVYVTANGVVVNYNNISGNTAYGVENSDTTNLLDAKNNWWGHASGPDDDEGVINGRGDKISLNVDAGSWLRTAPWVPTIPTKADILKDSGVPGKGLEKAPGQQKPFNPNSKAGEHAGKKDK